MHARGDGRDDDASERMLGAKPGVPALGRGPAGDTKPSRFSEQSDQPSMKHLVVEAVPSAPAR